MKQIYLAAAIVISCLQSSAQTASRLIASSFYIHDTTRFYLHDSTQYMFSGSRGGDLSSPYISFDDAVTYNYDTVSKSSSKYSRQIQAFDISNRRTGNTQLYWNKLISAWDYTASTDYSYDAAGNVSEDANRRWDDGLRSWVYTQRRTHLYDSRKNLISAQTEIWDMITLKWTFTDLLLYAYDAANNMTEKIYRQWDATAGAWQNVFRDSSYYSSGKQTLYLQQMWDNTSGKFTPNGKTTYTYDGSGFLATTDLKAYDPVAGNYHNLQLLSYTNDSRGNVLSYTFKLWDDATAVYKNREQRVGTYDSRNNQLSLNYMAWDDTTNAWMNTSLVKNSFDSRNNQLSTVTSNWDKAAAVWDSSDREDFSYNSRNQLTSDITAAWHPDGYWYNSYIDRKFLYYYEDYTPVSVTESGLKATALTIFPVPASDHMNLQLELPQAQAFRISCYDMEGRVWLQWQHQATASFHETVNVQQLPSGTYSIEVRTADGSRMNRNITILH